jgi:hypothetical protein
MEDGTRLDVEGGDEDLGPRGYGLPHLFADPDAGHLEAGQAEEAPAVGVGRRRSAAGREQPARYEPQSTDPGWSAPRRHAAIIRAGSAVDFYTLPGCDAS